MKIYTEIYTLYNRRLEIIFQEAIAERETSMTSVKKLQGFTKKSLTKK